MSSYYYDSTLATGSNNGTSWANAWKTAAAIDWDVLNVGTNTLFISGGSSGKTYGNGTASWIIRHNVSSESNRLTIRCGTDAGHTGPISIPGGIQFGDGGGAGWASYVTLDGSQGGARNIFISLNVAIAAQASAIYYRNVNQVYNKLLYLDLQVANGNSQTNGIELGSDADGTEIAYCNIHDIYLPGATDTWSGRGIREGSGSGAAYGRISIHHNLIGPNVAGDGIGIDGGVDVHYNIIDGTGCDNVTHADGIQGVKSHWRIHSNVIFNHGQEIFLETTSSAEGFWRIYNNFIYTNAATAGGLTSPGLMLRAKDLNGGGGAHGAIAWDNLLLANNTFYALGLPAIRFQADSGNTVTITNSALKNNLFLGNSSNVDMNGSGDGTFGWATGGFLWVKNLFYSGEATRWKSTSYTTVAALQAAQSDATGNLASNPLVTNASVFDLTLTSSSPARGAAQNLNTDFTDDLVGTLRVAWDIGAYEFVAASSTPFRLGFRLHVV